MGFEPTYDGFAIRCLTTWLRHPEKGPGSRRVPDPFFEPVRRLRFPAPPVSGDPYGIRTRIAALKGRYPNH